MEQKISIFNRTFIDLWAQKMMRNTASVKYQFMVAFFVVVVYGMFAYKDTDGSTFISAVEGLSFLSGGFITLVTSRLVIRTSLFEPKDESVTTKIGELDTDV